MIVWIGPEKLRVVGGAEAADVARAAGAPRISSKMPSASCRARPLALRAEQVLLGHHLEDRARRSGPCRRGRARGCPASRCARPAETSSGPRMRVVGQQAAAADAELRVALARPATPSISLMPGQTPPESCQPAAGAAEPLAEDRPGRDQPPLVLLRAARSSDCACPVARMQAAIRPASRLVETASREPLGMSLTLLTISSPSPGPTSARQQLGQALAGAFQARRDDARRRSPRP